MLQKANVDFNLGGFNPEEDTRPIMQVTDPEFEAKIVKNLEIRHQNCFF